MNDLTPRTNPYEQLMSVTDIINDSVNVIIKEKLVSQHPELASRSSFRLSDDDVSEARSNVAQLIGSLVDDSVSASGSSDTTTTLPNDLLDEYRNRLDDNPAARQRFEHLHDVLQSAEPIGEPEKMALDDLVLTLNNSRKQIFRKLRQSGSQ